MRRIEAKNTFSGNLWATYLPRRAASKVHSTAHPISVDQSAGTRRVRSSGRNDRSSPSVSGPAMGAGSESIFHRTEKGSVSSDKMQRHVRDGTTSCAQTQCRHSIRRTVFVSDECVAPTSSYRPRYRLGEQFYAGRYVPV